MIIVTIDDCLFDLSFTYLKLNGRQHVENKHQSLVLYGQATKCIRWMPRQLEAMKDVGACDKVRGAGKHALILTFPNGETHSV